MNKSSTIIVAIIIAAVVLWAGMSFLGKPQQSTLNGFLKIGILVPLTGDAAVYGEPARKVYQLAVEEINANGGVNGKSLDLIIEDSKCSGQDAANAASKLINVDKVEAIIGGICSSESLAAEPIATQKQVVILSPTSSSPDLTGKSRYFFRNYPSDASQGTILAEIAYSGKGFKTVGFIQEQSDFPLGIYKAFTAKFESLGGKIIKEEFAVGATDFRTQLVKLKSQNPDALFIDVQAAPAAERILKQMQELGWELPLLVPDVVAGDAPTVTRNASLLEGALTAEVSVDPGNEKFKHLLDAYKAKHKEDMPYQTYAQTEYDAVYLIKDGIAAVGYDGGKLASWSRTINNWSGASGRITIGQDGDLIGGHIAKIIRNGKVDVYTK